MNDEASDTAPSDEVALGGRLTQPLAEASGASGAPLRNGTTRPGVSTRITRGNSLDVLSQGSSELAQDNPAPPQARRQHWTRAMNTSLINAYYEATEGGTQTKKYAAKLVELWTKTYPDKQFTGKHLIAQIKNIKSRKLLSPDELEAMKADSVRKSPTQTINNIRRSIQRRSLQPQQERSPQPQRERSPQSQHEIISQPQQEVTKDDEATLGIHALFQEINIQWEGVEITSKPKISKLNTNKETSAMMKTIDETLDETFNNSTSLEELCHKVYCAAIMANTIQHTKTTNPNHQQQKRPPWEERIERKIAKHRQVIGVIHSYLNTDKPSKKLAKKAQSYARRKKLKKDDKEHLRMHMETMKQKIAALGSRMRRYHKRTRKHRENNLFSNNQKEFFKRLEEGHKNQREAPPNPAEMQKYWSNIWSKNEVHNKEASWIKTITEEQAGLDEMAPITITADNVSNTIRRMKNWTTPGIDHIHNYWWKTLKSTHRVLARLFQESLKNPGKIPKYFTHGTTSMLPKNEELSDPKNYRPITCLPSAYKILTSTIGFKVMTHLKDKKLLAWEQNGCNKKGRGAKELLVIDNTITKQAKKKLKNVSMAWIDYQKAFDSIPHSWLLEVLHIYKVNQQVIQLLKCLMSTWRTTLTVRHKTISYQTEMIKITRGIFQGDGFSSPWFCVALNPLSSMINRSAYGYAIDQHTTLSHLFYVDDLKLYARGRKQLEGQLELVRKFSGDVGMSLGLEKCATVEIKRGKLARQQNIQLVDGREIKSLAIEESYKYLGIHQTYEIKQQENKRNAENELTRRMRKLLGTELSAKNIITAINMWAIPAFTYSAGVLTWSKTDLEKIDRKIRTTLTQHGLLHPNSAVERIYLPRREGGRGLSNLKEACRKEEENIRDFFLKKNHPIHQWVATHLRTSNTAERSLIEEPERQNKLEELKQSWKSKSLHGRFYASLQQEEVDKTKTHTYLMQGYLYPQTEGTLMAIQDQVIPTRTYVKHIMQQQIESTKCRLCNNAEETIQHLSSGCSQIAGTKYLARHNEMGKVVHQLICLQEGLLRCFTPHHLYTPQALLENDNIKIYWDLTIVTDRGVEHNRPDMVVWNKTETTALIIDFAVPLDNNIAKAYGEKMTKYESLARQMRDMWKLRSVRIIPLIITANGLVHRKTAAHIEELKLPSNTLTWMQKAVILGTVGIIRQIIYPY